MLCFAVRSAGGGGGWFASIAATFNRSGGAVTSERVSVGGLTCAPAAAVGWQLDGGFGGGGAGCRAGGGGGGYTGEKFSSITLTF